MNVSKGKGETKMLVYIDVCMNESGYGFIVEKVENGEFSELKREFGYPTWNSAYKNAEDWLDTQDEDCVILQ